MNIKTNVPDQISYFLTSSRRFDFSRSQGLPSSLLSFIGTHHPDFVRPAWNHGDYVLYSYMSGQSCETYRQFLFSYGIRQRPLWHQNGNSNSELGSHKSFRMLCEMTISNVLPFLGTHKLSRGKEDVSSARLISQLGVQKSYRAILWNGIWELKFTFGDSLMVESIA